MIDALKKWWDSFLIYLFDPCCNLDVEDELEEVGFLPFELNELENETHRRACYLLSLKIIDNINDEEKFSFFNVEMLFDYIYLNVLDDLNKDEDRVYKFKEELESSKALTYIGEIKCATLLQDEEAIDSLFELIASFLNLDKS